MNPLSSLSKNDQKAFKSIVLGSKLLTYPDIPNLKKAEKCFRESIKFKPNNPIAYFQLAIVFLKYEKQKYIEEAICNLQTALDYDPTYEKAEKVLDILLKSNPPKIIDRKLHTICE